MYRCCHLDVITKGKLLIYNWYKQRYNAYQIRVPIYLLILYFHATRNYNHK
jgi:hypothetical protein